MTIEKEGMREEETPIPSIATVISAMFLVAGTCMGGGMLALPVSTGVNGFIPSSLMMALCWMAMTFSALLLLEVNLWMKEGAHIITMADTFLGPIGKLICWIVFLFISYASTVAYTAAGGTLILHSTHYFLGWLLSKEMACFIFITFFGGLIYLGSRIVGRVNAILFIAMIVAYIGLVGTGIHEVKISNLKQVYWPTSFLAIPLLLTSFSFQTMLPSLTPYLKRHASSLRWAIVGGTTLTFLVYLIWQWLVLGIVPIEGHKGLSEALEVGEPITQFLRHHIQSPWIAILAEYFSFFALVTSFLGMALGLFDFLSDGLSIPNRGWGKVVLSLLIMIPTFIFAAYFERVFLLALETSGGFGDTILNGIIPVAMVWIGRYIFHFPNENRLFGGKGLLIGILLFFSFGLLLEILSRAGMTCIIFEAC